MYLEKISSNDKKGDKKRSDGSVARFAETAIKNNYTPIRIVEDNTFENGNLGIDIWITMNGISTPIDVKAKCTKGINLFVLEQQNNMGDTGSVFKDNTEFFAFERKSCFVLFKTKDLRDLYLQKVYCFQTPTVSNDPSCWDPINNRPVLYKVMTRSNYRRKKDGKPNDDRFAYFSFKDVLKLDYILIPILN